MQVSIRRKMTSVALAVLLVLGGGVLAAVGQVSVQAQPAFAAQKGAWKTTSGKWWYAYNDGSFAKSGWVSIDGTWYLFDESGWMKTGWQKVGGAWYYLTSSGVMATGWQKIGGSWYHLNTSGVMSAKKWVGDYYVDSSGVMATNRWIGSYYVGSDGKWDRNAGSGATNSSTVYWVSSGKVYHITKDCPSLSRSKNIKSGTISQSGKSRVCKNCG